MFGGFFHCFPTENKREPRGKDFQKKKGTRRDSRREKRGTGEQTSLQRSKLLIFGRLKSNRELTAAD